MTAARDRLEMLPLPHGFAAVLVLKTPCPLNGFPCGCGEQQRTTCAEAIPPATQTKPRRRTK